MTTIDSFSGEFEFLSNFYPCQVMFDGVVWKSVEHAYQAAKTDSCKERTAIYGATSPARAKRLGAKVRLRKGWDQLRLGVMKELVRDKFVRSAELRQKLIYTQHAQLVEGNTWGDRLLARRGGLRTGSPAVRSRRTTLR
jgi:hypothetical protein